MRKQTQATKLRTRTKLLTRLGIAGATIVGLVVAGFSANPAAAACAAPSTNYGTATIKLSVDTATDYRMWVHMYAPNATNDSLLLEVDGSSCYVVGDGGVDAKTWTWVNHQNGNTGNRITASLSKGTHTVKLIGREPDVKVDRVLAVSDQNCTPANSGENCITQPDSTQPAVAITSPKDGASVTDSVTLKANATDDTGIAKVEFYAQGKLLATDTTAPYEYNWDVSGQANGIVTVSAKAYDKAGNSSTDSIAVTIGNTGTKAPAAPGGVSATAESYNKVSVHWDAVDGAAKYRVARDNLVIATVGSTNYSDDSVSADTTYSYSVVAVDANNNASDASAVAKVTTPKPPTTDSDTPTQPTALSATAQGPTQINLAWKASSDDIGVKEYVIYRNSDEDKTFRKLTTTTKTSYGDGSVYDNTTFTYYVVARDASGNESPASDKAAARTPRLADRRTSTLRGTVHGRNGRPLAGVRVSVWVDGKRYTTTTNWRGRYIITDIPAGRYEVHYNKRGYDRDTEDVRLRAHHTKWQDVRLNG